MLVIQLIQASVSLKRVNNYLNLKEINPKAITREKSVNNAIEMKNASFTWDTEAPPAIENISFDIPKGSLVAIVGQVKHLAYHRMYHFAFYLGYARTNYNLLCFYSIRLAQGNLLY